MLAASRTPSTTSHRYAGSRVVLGRLLEQTAPFWPGVGLGLAVYREDGSDASELLKAAEADIVRRSLSASVRTAWNEHRSLS